MSEPRMLGLVSSCGTCPHRIYYSGGQDKCSKVDQIVIDKNKVASFCPLPLYPAGRMTDMESALRALQAEAGKQPFSLVALSYIAGKLGLEISAEGQNLRIPLKEAGEEVWLLRDYVLETTVFPRLEVVFMYKETKYRLLPEMKPPRLYKIIPHPGGQELKDLEELLALAP